MPGRRGCLVLRHCRTRHTARTRAVVSQQNVGPIFLLPVKLGAAERRVGGHARCVNTRCPLRTSASACMHTALVPPTRHHPRPPANRAFAAAVSR
eukprot:354954-Chlamydomonas_euryale.AAC.11